jgi:ribulose-phosphate 3-epimerase
MAKIIPGILTNSGAEYREWLIKASHVSDLIQIDVIDGKFANNLTIGLVEIKKYPTKSNLEVQLMVVSPLEYIKELKHVDYVSRIIVPFEIEGCEEAVYMIKQLNKQAGISINPETPVSAIRNLADHIDLVCIFSASPGFAGRKLEKRTYERIKESKKLYHALPVEIDIGVNFETAPRLAESGADFLIATSVLKGADDYYLAYEKLANLASANG